jgi:hypothetical protein
LNGENRPPVVGKRAKKMTAKIKRVIAMKNDEISVDKTPIVES